MKLNGTEFDFACVEIDIVSAEIGRVGKEINIAFKKTYSNISEMKSYWKEIKLGIKATVIHKSLCYFLRFVGYDDKIYLTYL